MWSRASRLGLGASLLTLVTHGAEVASASVPPGARRRLQITWPKTWSHRWDGSLPTTLGLTLVAVVSKSWQLLCQLQPWRRRMEETWMSAFPSSLNPCADYS